ncbi:MAG: hypothetical protein ACK5LY_03020 [Lachnospirales bacterium]
MSKEKIEIILLKNSQIFFSILYQHPHFVALVRRVLYKTTALWLFDKNCGNGVFLPFQAFVKSMKI